MKNAGLIVVMLLLFVSSSAYGAAIGQSHDEQGQPRDEQGQPRPYLEQPQRTSMIGYSIGAASISVDDPAGDTDAVMSLQPITLIYTARLWSSMRYWSEFYYYQSTLDADLNKIGQDFQRYGIRLSLQRSLQVTPQWSLWIGAGLDTSHVRYTSRHMVDDEGFLLRTYPDRDGMTTAAVINILGEWSFSSVWTIGAKLEQSFPGSGDIKKSSLTAVTLLYKY